MSQYIRRMSKEDLDRLNETSRAFRESRHQPAAAVERSGPDLGQESSPPLPDAIGVQLDLL